MIAAVLLPALVVTAIGLLAQCFFSARTLVQWIMSERAHKVLSPSLFWIFSVAGSILLALYGYLRQDFSIVLGQFLSYYIYLWNIKTKRIKLPVVVWGILIAIPITALLSLMGHAHEVFDDFFGQNSLPQWLIVYGSVGQVLFTLRFIYQWWYSRQEGVSVLPPGFWWISLIGAGIIFSYGLMRLDIVLLLGQGFGLIVYIRNLIIGKRQKIS